MAAPGPGIQGADVAGRYVALPDRERLAFDRRGTVTLNLGRASGAAGAVVVFRNASGAAVGSETIELAAGTDNVAKVHIAPAMRRRVNREKRLPVDVTVRVMDSSGTRAAITSRFQLVNGAR
jgi:hypothetical protein